MILPGMQMLLENAEDITICSMSMMATKLASSSSWKSPQDMTGN